MAGGMGVAGNWRRVACWCSLNMAKKITIPPEVLTAIKSGFIPVVRDWRSLKPSQWTRAEKVCAFIERYCKVPEGMLVGQPIKLALFQEVFIYAVYDNPNTTYEAILSIGRKNAKTALAACLVLVHTVGPEALLNSEIVSGARSREQAAKVFNYASKMIALNPDLAKIAKTVPSAKRIIGGVMNVEYHATSAEAKTSHGGSPILAILDETGQVSGPYDAFIEAIETSQGAHDTPLRLHISTQAPQDGDFLSMKIDDAESSQDPHIVAHVYTAPEGCDLTDPEMWRLANPAMGLFRVTDELERAATKAERMPSAENSFRWLYLNQRITAHNPFISRSIWVANGAPVAKFEGKVYGGLDLSSVSDLTSLVLVNQQGDKWHVEPHFWLPGDTLFEKSKADRVQYDVWHKEGYLHAAPGRSIDYDFVARFLFEMFDRYQIEAIAFDRWNMKHLVPCLLRAGFSDEQIEAHFVEFGQGFQSISPALRTLEVELLEERLCHGGHPLLNMCAANAIVYQNSAGDRKLDKSKSTGRIDGMVALAMAMATAAEHKENNEGTYLDYDDLMVL
jgi:phage terminase large subunit-like protein